jgi:hypothetical protein
MALSTAGIARQPVSSLLPPLVVAARAQENFDEFETIRPVVPSQDVQLDDAAYLHFDQLQIQRVSERRRQPGAISYFSDRPDIEPAEAPTRIFAPRGAPSDAVPALTRLEARFTFDPLYIQNRAAALYALISRIPTSLADRRLAYDILA